MGETGIEWIVIVMLIGYGLFYVIWPGKARQQYMSHFDVASPIKWYKPNTYMRHELPAVAFRVVGVVFIVLSIFVFYVCYSR
jgi:hypothetical protein